MLHQLLDDVPVTTLLSASVYAQVGHPLPYADRVHRLPAIDTCAGWAAGAAMAVASADGQPHYLGEGPPVPDLGLGDERRWHELPPLPALAFRRLRMLDVIPIAGGVVVDAWFRDTFCEPGGIQTGIHEYSVEARVEADGNVADVLVLAHVLPGPDCHGAVASAARLVGHPVAALSDLVSSELVGPSTCTHLNDLLRSIAGMSTVVRRQLGKIQR